MSYCGVRYFRTFINAILSHFGFPTQLKAPNHTSPVDWRCRLVLKRNSFKWCVILTCPFVPRISAQIRDLNMGFFFKDNVKHCPDISDTTSRAGLERRHVTKCELFLCYTNTWSRTTPFLSTREMVSLEVPKLPLKTWVAAEPSQSWSVMCQNWLYHYTKNINLQIQQIVVITYVMANSYILIWC